MAKVTVHDGQSPSEQLVASATKEIEVTDARGRKLVLRKPPFMYQFRLIETLPDEIASKQAYMLMIAPALYVSTIDGDPVGLPLTKLEIEALLERLDEDGYQAALDGMGHFGQATGAEGLDATKK